MWPVEGQEAVSAASDSENVQKTGQSQTKTERALSSPYQTVLCFVCLLACLLVCLFVCFPLASKPACLLICLDMCRAPVSSLLWVRSFGRKVGARRLVPCVPCAAGRAGCRGPAKWWFRKTTVLVRCVWCGGGGGRSSFRVSPRPCAGLGPAGHAFDSPRLGAEWAAAGRLYASIRGWVEMELFTATGNEAFGGFADFRIF